MFGNSYFEPELFPYYNPKTTNKIAVVTGGNQGIGYYTILHLYLHGFKIYMLGRSESKCLDAVESIKEEAEKRVAKYNDHEKDRYIGSVTYVKCDLSDLSSVETAAKAVLDKESHLDILVNNAGVVQPFEMTKDNYEIQYQVHVAAHMLLTLKLLPLLEKTDKPRVVHVSSLVHTSVVNYLKTDRFVNGRPANYYSMVRYGIAKLEVIHFIRALAEKHPKILCIALHPGIIITNLYTPSVNTVASVIKPFANAGLKVMGFVAGVSPEVGSYATLRAALDPSLTAEKNNGMYLTTGGNETSTTKTAQNMGYARSTWDWNVKQLQDRGFKFDV